MESDVNSLMSEIENIKTKIKESESAFEANLKEIENLESTLISNQQKIVDLNSAISESLIQKDLLKQNNKNISAKIEHLKNKNENQNESLSEVNKVLAKSKTENKEIKEKHQQKKLELQKLKSTNHSNQITLNQIIQEIDILTKEMKRFSTEYYQLKQYKEQEDDFNNQIQRLNINKQLLELKLKQAQENKERQGQIIEQIRKDNSNLVNSLDQINQESKSLKDNILKLETKTKFNPLNFTTIDPSLIITLNEQISKKELELIKVKTEQKSIENEIESRKQSQNQNIDQEIQELRQKRYEMATELFQDKSKLNELIQEKEELENPMVPFKFYNSDNKELFTKLKHIHEQLKQMKSKKIDFAEQIRKLKRISQKLENDLEYTDSYFTMFKVEDKAENHAKIEKIKDDYVVDSHIDQIKIVIDSQENQMKINHDEIDKLHNENRDAMMKLLNIERELIPKKMKNKKKSKTKQPFYY